MKVLITGGAGFIGSHLAEHHLNQKDTVYTLDNYATGSQKNIQHLFSFSQFHHLCGDIVTFTELKSLLSCVDRVYHLAAVVGAKHVIAHPIDTLKINIEGTVRLLEALSTFQKPPRLLIASTSEVYGPMHENPLVENSPLIIHEVRSKRSTYSTSKIAAESYIQAFYDQYNLPVTTLRLFNTIGPRQTGRYGMVVPRFIKNAKVNQPLEVYGTGEQTRCFIDVRDLVVLLDKIGSTASLNGKITNVGHDEEISITALAKLIKQLAHSTSEIKNVSYETAYGEDLVDFKVRKPDLTQLREHIHYQLQWTLTQTLQDLLNNEHSS